MVVTLLLSMVLQVVRVVALRDLVIMEQQEIHRVPPHHKVIMVALAALVNTLSAAVAAVLVLLVAQVREGFQEQVEVEVLHIQRGQVQPVLVKMLVELIILQVAVVVRIHTSMDIGLLADQAAAGRALELLRADMEP